MNKNIVLFFINLNLVFVNLLFDIIFMIKYHSKTNLGGKY